VSKRKGKQPMVAIDNPAPGGKRFTVLRCARDYVRRGHAVWTGPRSIAMLRDVVPVRVSRPESDGLVRKWKLRPSGMGAGRIDVWQLVVSGRAVQTAEDRRGA
jgi:hypothetical protein